MTKQTEFQKQLSDPRWQKKRLEILERDEWTCQTCGDTKATLTVHHKSYRMTDGKFADVWDYDGNDLITLCETCHALEESILATLQKNLFFQIRAMSENSETIQGLLILLEQLANNNGGRIHMSAFADFHTQSTEDQ